MVAITQEIVKEFNSSYECVDLAMFLKDEHKDTYTLLFSSKTLDDMPPFESTLKVVKFFREHNSEILEKISSIITIHSEDDDIDRIKKIMLKKDGDFFIDYSERLELFGAKIDNGIILKTEQSLAWA